MNTDKKTDTPAGSDSTATPSAGSKNSNAPTSTPEGVSEGSSSGPKRTFVNPGRVSVRTETPSRFTNPGKKRR